MRRGLKELLWRDSSALVLDLCGKGSAFQDDANGSGGASAVTMNIRETFLYDSEDSQFHISGESPKRRRDLEAGINFAAFCESCNIAVEGRRESGLIQ
jgi:hypothetical protein